MSADTEPESTTEAKPPTSLKDSVLRPVFIPASIAVIGLITFTVIFSRVAGDTLESAVLDLNAAIADGVGWWYVIAVNIFLIFVVYCAFSRIGRIKLGRDDEKPEFSVIAWFLMLFSAGMGIGLVFFGVAEPLSHYVIPPDAFGNAPESIAAASDSVGLMMLQWGLHPWAIYALVGLGLAYMTFRRGRPLAVRWLLEPLIGRKRVEGWIGHTIDTVAIVGTLFGVATSLGFGVSQIMGGLEYLGWASRSNALIIGLIVVITGIAIWSVVSGVHKGLKWLSNINMSVAAMLALVVFLLGPTILLLKAIPQNAGSYLSQLPETAFHVGAFNTDGWETAWTIGYWGWWTSWAPFVGMFIARISRGRTIRQFVCGVLLAPTAASLVWFTIFGATAINEQRQEGTLTVTDPETGAPAVNSDTALFQLFETFPSGFAVVLSVIAMIVIALFFITSSDSGSLVIDMLASGGRTDTAVTTRVFWAALEGVAAAVLLVVGGSVALTALQTLSLATAAPFTVILVLGCISLLRAFRHDVATMPNYMHVISRSTANGDEPSTPPSGKGARRRLRELRDVSATFAGLPLGSDRTHSDDRPIVAFRPISQSNVRPDPETGAPELANEVEDPLAGQVWNTPEFEASQEYLDQLDHRRIHEEVDALTSEHPRPGGEA